MDEDLKMERREFLGVGAAAAAAVVTLGPWVGPAVRPLEGLSVAVDDEACVARLRAAGAHVVRMAGRAETAERAVAVGECASGVSGIPASRTGIYAYERARRRVDTVGNLLLGTTVPIARSLPDLLRVEGVLRGETVRNERPSRWPGRTRIAVRRGVRAAERVADGLVGCGATIVGVDFGEATRTQLERRVFRAGSDVLVLPGDRTEPELAAALAWYPVIRIPAGVMLVGASDDSRAVTAVAAAWANHREA